MRSPTRSPIPTTPSPSRGRTARGVVDFTPFIERGELFAALEEPGYFVREMSIMRHGIGLT
jgi:hypothetical protein